MKRPITSTFLACLLAGCVTVSGQEANGQFDKIKAADARIVLGLSYLEAGNMIKARENLELAVKYAPDYYRSQSSLAYLYDRIGEYHMAEVAYKKALRKSPKNGDILNNYGVFLCKLGEYKKADEYFNRAIEQPDYYLTAGSYENAAVCALKSGNKNRAEHYFERSLDYDPYRRLPFLQLARLEIDRGELDDARDRLLKFHQKFGYSSQSLGLLTELETQADNDALAEKYQKKLKANYPDFK